jgi:type IV pilus assembly protein PilO
MQLRALSEQLWKSQRRTLILLMALLVLNLLAYVVVKGLIVPGVIAQETHFLQRQAEVRQLLRNQGGATTPEQLYVLANQDFSKFQQAVPEYQDFTGLIEELLVLSSRARLNLTQISYHSETMKEAPFLKFNLDFNVTGDYAQLKRFIFSLEQSVRLIVIRQISLQSADDTGVNLRLGLETYFRTENGKS